MGGLAANDSTTNVFTGGGGRRPIDRQPWGGDPDPGRGDDNRPSFAERLRRGRLGMCIALASVVMLFVAISILYVARANMDTMDAASGLYARGSLAASVGGSSGSHWKTLQLPIPLLLWNTFLLLLSSFTMELSRRDYARRMALAPVYAMPGISTGPEIRVPWLAFTILLGCGFLAGQAWAWLRIYGNGVNVAWNPSSSFFFLLTGTHAVHLVGGLLALLYAGMLALFSASVERRRMVVDITALYWHVMGLLWVGLFGLLAFVG